MYVKCPRAHGDIYKFPVLSDQLSKTQITED